MKVNLAEQELAGNPGKDVGKEQERLEVAPREKGCDLPPDFRRKARGLVALVRVLQRKKAVQTPGTTKLWGGNNSARTHLAVGVECASHECACFDVVRIKSEYGLQVCCGQRSSREDGGE